MTQTVSVNIGCGGGGGPADMRCYWSSVYRRCSTAPFAASFPTGRRLGAAAAVATGKTSSWGRAGLRSGYASVQVSDWESPSYSS